MLSTLRCGVVPAALLSSSTTAGNRARWSSPLRHPSLTPFHYHKQLQLGALLGVQRPKSKELPASKPLAFLCILKRVISVEHRCTQISASQASMEIYGSVD